MAQLLGDPQAVAGGAGGGVGQPAGGQDHSLAVERGNRVFPASDKSIDIIDALFFELKRLNVTLTTWQRVSSVTLKDGAVSSVEIGTARDKWGWGEPCNSRASRVGSSRAGFKSMAQVYWSLPKSRMWALADSPVDEAIATSGGIKASEVDPKTMMSKKIPGLFFAGEMLDVDALGSWRRTRLKNRPSFTSELLCSIAFP